MIDRERWQRIDDLFARAVDLPDGERDGFLARECGGDRELAAEVASLVARADTGAARLRDAVAATADSLATDVAGAAVGRRFGPYRVKDVIGEGGMGTVYLAERDDAEFHHRVAIKILQHGLASPQVIARFRDERQILAALEHPAIVRLLDGGTTDDGLPYLVMEHIDGVALAAYARGRPVRERIALIIEVAAALSYAHQRLVIHRDIKPSNILVTAEGRPKLLDFGIAKLLEASATPEREARTRTGVALLTPEYASPEQARGEPVNVATDVYSLGAVLYELLAGRPPQRPTDNVLETLRAICEVDPPRPSTLAPPAERHAIAGDLDNITLRALQKDPARRYPSVATFAEDLERHLTSRPVVARDATLVYRLGKFARRNRVSLAIAAAVAAALATATVVSVIQARRASTSAAAARRQNRTLLVEQGRQELAQGHAGRALPFLVAAWRDGEDTPAMRFLIAEAMRPYRQITRTIDDLAPGLEDVAWSPDGTRFAAVGYRGRVRIYDRDGALVAARDLGTDLVLWTVVFAADGRRLLVGDADGALHVLEQDGRPAEIVRGRGGRVRWTGFLAGGTRALSLTTNGVAITELASGARVLDDEGAQAIAAIALSPDETRLVVARADGAIDELDPRTGVRARGWLEPGDRSLGVVSRSVAGSALRFDRAGTRLFSLHGAQIAIWDVARAAPLRTIVDRAHPPSSFTVSPDGRTLVTVAARGTVRLWDVDTGTLQVELAGHGAGDMRAADWTPDGTRVVTSAIDGTYRVADAASGRLEAALELPPVAGTAPHASALSVEARVSPDGARVLSPAGARLVLWRPDPAPLLLDRIDREQIYGAALSPAGDRLVTVGYRGLLSIWDVARGERKVALDAGHKVWDASWRADGQVFAIAGDDAFVELRRATDGERLATLGGHTGTVNCVHFAPVGMRLATCGDDGTAAIRDGDTGAVLLALAHPGRVLDAAWSRDGRRLATAGWDGALRLWDAARGTLLAVVRDPDTQFLAVAFTPDERGLVAGEHDGRVAAWSLATGARVRTFEGHNAPATWVGYSPDGRLLATTAYDHTARLWDPATGRELARRAHGDGVMQGVWTADGARLVTVGVDHHVRVWSAARDAGTARDAAAFVEANVPWRLVDGRLTRATGR